MLNFFAACNNLGMGVHGFNMAKALDARGHEIALFPPFGQTALDSEQIAKWRANTLKFSVDDPSVMIFDTAFMAQFAGTPRIAFPVFETDVLSKRDVRLLGECDFVLTPSKWGQKVLRAHGIDSHVVHEGYDPAVFEHAPAPAPRHDDEITFFHVGKFEERKGTLQLIRCFFRALEKKRAVLKMHIHNPFVANYQPVVQLLSKLGFREIAGQEGHIWRRQDLRIEFTARDIPVQQMAVLYQQADCCVFPTKGEGFGLPIIEAIACGTPAIAGNWTGQSEFLGDNWPDMLSFSGKSIPAEDGVWYFGDRGNWIAPYDRSVELAIMWAHANVRAFRKTDVWQKEVARIRGFTWARAAEEFEDFFK